MTRAVNLRVLAAVNSADSVDSCTCGGARVCVLHRNEAFFNPVPTAVTNPMGLIIMAY